MRTFHRVLSVAIAAAVLSTPVTAAELTGTLKKIKDSGTITLGHRDSSIPFSYFGDNSRQPIGYSHDLQLKVVEAIKEHGAVAIQQLYHVGAHGDSDNSFHPHWSPSGGPSYHDSDGSHPMTEAEILETIDGFVEAARRCRDAGFDGVEVWAAYLGMVDQFWTPWRNRRDDQWGGSLENRTRMSREILTRIRQVCGPDFIVGLAVSDEPDVKVALQRDELAKIIRLHDELGLIDYVTCGSGGYLDFYKLMPTFLYPEKLGADLASVLKGVVRNAVVIAESHIRTPENAETVLGEGSADLVSIVRGQIADPHLATKAGDDRPDEIRGCISCNQMCWGRRSRDYWISCLINPSVGRESEWNGDRFVKTGDPKRLLVVGGGPAGASAAIYAARKGIRTGVAAERFGGQVLDTMAIENFISVPYTEGPKLAAALEQHVKDYQVDVMNLQRAEKLVPAGADGLVEVQLANGASLKSKTVILSTGARWRQMNVPGENEYRNKGVAYCPHCDGPLFKGKRVAVIGGGNSGVEAAIDLAGIVAQVTLIEFDGKLRADEVLQRKLHSLPNVRVVTSAQTTEVLGDGSKVTGLVYKDRVGGDTHRVELEGIFVQIGLLPNTEWLKGVVELSPRGEIVIDDRGQTSVPGVFAAGDATTVPYKQIVIAMGEGSKAALSAFDHLIRSSAPVETADAVAA